MRLQFIEWLGVALVAAAVAFVHVAFALAVVGVYLFVSSVVSQVLGGTDGSEETEH